jgi:hypothetical protein
MATLFLPYLFRSIFVKTFVSWFTAFAAVAAFMNAAAAMQVSQPAAPVRTPDVIFVPTPQDVVDVMLQAAKVGPDDVLYDLGSGNGIIPVTAAKRFGARGVGIDIDPQRIAEARANAEKTRWLIRSSLFRATCLSRICLKPQSLLYLLNSLNLKLRPKLLDLKPGTRIVSHAFDMGNWAPTQTIDVDGRSVYLWIVPQKK